MARSFMRVPPSALRVDVRGDDAVREPTLDVLCAMTAAAVARGGRTRKRALDVLGETLRALEILVFAGESSEVHVFQPS